MNDRSAVASPAVAFPGKKHIAARTTATRIGHVPYSLRFTGIAPVGRVGASGGPPTRGSRARAREAARRATSGWSRLAAEGGAEGGVELVRADGLEEAA